MHPVPYCITDINLRQLSFLKMFLVHIKQVFTLLITQDETWVHHFDPESKMQSMRWKHPGSPLPRSLRELLRQ